MGKAEPQRLESHFSSGGVEFSGRSSQEPGAPPAHLQIASEKPLWQLRGDLPIQTMRHRTVVEIPCKCLLVLKIEKKFSVSNVTWLQIIVKNHTVRKDLAAVFSSVTFPGIKMPGALGLTFDYGNSPFDPDLRSP